MPGFAQALRHAGDRLTRAVGNADDRPAETASDGPGAVGEATADAAMLAGLAFAPQRLDTAVSLSAGTADRASLAPTGGHVQPPAHLGSQPAGRAARQADPALTDALAADIASVAASSAPLAPDAVAAAAPSHAGVAARGGGPEARPAAPSASLPGAATPAAVESAQPGAAAPGAADVSRNPDANLVQRLAELRSLQAGGAAPGGDTHPQGPGVPTPAAITGSPATATNDATWRPPVEGTAAVAADGQKASTGESAPPDSNRQTEPALAMGPARLGEAAAPPASSLAPAAPPAREPATSFATVPTAVASAAWPQDVAQTFAQFVSLGVGDAEIHLNPAHLGPVGIEITYGDRQASVLITAAQPATRDALEQALPHLKELLAQQGIALGESAVRDHREARADAGSYRPSSGDGPAREGAPRAQPAEDGIRDRTLRPSSRLIDTFA